MFPFVQPVITAIVYYLFIIYVRKLAIESLILLFLLLNKTETLVRHSGAALRLAPKPATL